LARKYAEYPKLVARLIDLFESAKAVDEEVSRINGSAPPGEHRRLLGVELTARSLESFSTADPAVAKGVQLPDWVQSARTVWPPAANVQLRVPAFDECGVDEQATERNERQRCCHNKICRRTAVSKAIQSLQG
jgi:hypothetical protein